MMTRMRMNMKAKKTEGQEPSGEEEEYESDTCWIEEGSEGILEDKKTGQNCNLQN